MLTFLDYFKIRHREDELMDLPETGRDEFEQALCDIQWVNRNLGGTRTLLNEMISMLPAQLPETLRILDLGTGSADIPRALVEWFRRNKPRVRVEITAVDLHPVAVETAANECRNYPEIRVLQGDALHMTDVEASFDFVVSSMFMHHLENEDAIRLLQEMARLCRIGFVVNDLQRHPLAWLSIKALGVLTGKGRVFLNDAPLSVLRGFTREELEALRMLAGLHEMGIKHCRPFRWVLCWQRPVHAGVETSGEACWPASVTGPGPNR